MNILEMIDWCMEQGMSEETAGLWADEAFGLTELEAECETTYIDGEAW